MNSSHWPQIILFGDSITQESFGTGGWGAFIADKLQRKCDVLNRGLWGYNTALAKVALQKILPKSQVSRVAFITICLGANDAALEEVFPEQYVPLTEYVANLKEMIEYLEACGLQKSQILMITPPPVCDEKFKAHCRETWDSRQSKTNMNTALYAKACCTFTKDHGIDVLNMYTVMQEEPEWGRFLGDGLHLSPDGDRFFGQQVWKILEEKTTTMPMQLPDWKDVDPTHPEKAMDQFS